MANNSNAVAILAPDSNGLLWYAPLGTVVPDDLKTLSLTAFKCAGYISSDGFSYDEQSDTSDPVVAFGGDPVVSPKTKIKPVLKFTLLETGNPDALKLAYADDDVVGTEVNNVKVYGTDATPEPCVMILKLNRGSGITEYQVFKNASFASREEVKNDNDTPDSLGVTWNIRKDSSNRYYTKSIWTTE